MLLALVLLILSCILSILICKLVLENHIISIYIFVQLGFYFTNFYQWKGIGPIKCKYHINIQSDPPNCFVENCLFHLVVLPSTALLNDQLGHFAHGAIL